MSRPGIIAAMLLIPMAIGAQNQVAQFKVESSILWAGVDRAGDLFLILNTGEVQKFGHDGVKIGTHTFRQPPTLFDPMDGAQSFYFFQDQLQYGNLSSDLADVTIHHVDPAFAIRPWLVCPSLRELWILDSADFAIKKTKLSSTTISLESALKHLPQKKMEDYAYMREYQNYLFLLDRNAGIHVFNNVGVYTRTLGEPQLTWFGFYGEELYYKRGQELLLTDLFSGESRKMSLPQPCTFAILADNYLYAVEDQRVVVYSMK